MKGESFVKGVNQNFPPFCIEQGEEGVQRQRLKPENGENLHPILILDLRDRSHCCQDLLKAKYCPYVAAASYTLNTQRCM